MHPHIPKRRPTQDHDRLTERIRSMHDIFSNPLRCAVLYYLQEVEDPADVDEMVNEILSWCPDEDVPDGDSDQSDQTWFFHEHVVRMDEFGVVRYDPRQHSVRLSDSVCVTVPFPWKNPDASATLND